MQQRHLSSGWAFLVLVSLLAGGCGGQAAFATTYQDSQPKRLTAVMERIQTATRHQLLPVVVGASADSGHVFAYDLQHQRLLWKVEGQPASPPLIAGDVVVVHEPGRLRVLQLSDGKLLEDRHDDHLALMGADGDGNVSAIVMSSGGSAEARSQLLTLVGGRVHSTTEAGYPLGAPAVLGGLVFVPWNNVYVSALDADGSEIARLRIRKEAVSRALARDGAVYFGQQGLFRFDPVLADGSMPESAHFRPEKKDLPGNPAFLAAANKPPPPVRSALHRVALSFEPHMRGGKLGLTHDQLYLTFYRHIFALHPEQPRPAWVYEHGADIVGAEASGQGLMFADETGTLTLIGPGGSARWSAALGLAPAVAQFRVEGFAPPLGPAPEPAALADQLAAAAMNPDARLVPSRAMAVELLGTLPGDNPTAHLIGLCEEQGVAPRVRQAACDTLSKRTEGPDPVNQALERHANYLEDEGQPPVGALASAAANIGDTRAIPLLLSHLEDPATPTRELPVLMAALARLADPSVVPPVEAFLRLYHAADEDPDMQRTLEIAVDLLVAQDRASATEVLEAVAQDELSMPPLRGYTAQVLSSQPEPGENGAERTGDAEAEAPAEPDEMPTRLTPQHLEHALGAEALAALRQCLRHDVSHPESARLTVVVDAEGYVLLVRSLPESLNACAEPLVLKAKLPPNRFAKQQQILYRLTR